MATNVAKDPAVTDPYEVRNLYKYLCVVDVCDVMDGIGYFNIGNVSTGVRPLWLGMKFWGPAVTIRCVPSNRPMWKLNTTQKMVDVHRIWLDEVGNVGITEFIKPGCDDDGVVVVPQEVAEEVAGHAVAILLADMRGRMRLYARLKMPADETVDIELVETYYKGLGAL
jgi:regulator of RNase E activity RraA